MTRPFLIFLAILTILGFVVCANNVSSQTNEGSQDTMTNILKSECINEGSYIFKIRHFMLYITDTVYERYSTKYLDSMQKSQIEKGKVTPFTQKRKVILMTLLRDKREYCCVYDLKNKSWLATIRYRDDADLGLRRFNKKVWPCKEIAYFGEIKILKMIRVYRRVEVNRKEN